MSGRSFRTKEVTARFAPAVPIVAVSLLLVAAAARAQTPQAAPGPQNQAPSASQPQPNLEDKAKDLSNRQIELKSIQDTIQASEGQRRKIEAQIESLRGDRARLEAALIATAQQVSATEAKVSEAEARIENLKGREEAIRRSLESRRAVIAQVLASLQRMGRTPPPALLVTPTDMLKAIRTSMLLGAVLPQMRAETEALATDLSNLIQLRQSIAAEKAQLAQQAQDLGEQRQKLAALIDARQAALGVAEQALAAERDRSANLASQATNLMQLITRSEAELAGAKRAADAARKADAARAAQAEAGIQKNVSPFDDPGRLAPAMAFADVKGLLPMPVSGTIVRSYGTPDGFGGTEKGLLVATQPGAIVAAPYDGWVAFSGPYRSYGQLLIINAGTGYYMVLAGMERINVEAGQFVLAGEPVASMGDGSVKTAAAIAIGAAQPILYVEFRKDGAAIDPSPWWAKPDMQRVRG
ncbi:MAG: peptidoglycan DD-metalloendopeptidase family protein [Methylovirgula sp.]|jgi:murein hydrolase activator